jgi:hypothetical protein
MKLRFFVLSVVVAVLCSVTPNASGQYPIMPGYRMPGQPMMAPPGMLPPGMMGGGGMYAPVMPAAAAAPIVSPGMVAPAGGPMLAPPPAMSPVVQAGFGSPSCEVSCVSSGCDGRCGSGCSSCCSSGGFGHCWDFYGEFLYLRARDAEVAWAAPIDGPIVPGPVNNNPIQIAPFGVADMDYQPGWRGGFQYNLSDCTAISAQYTMFESSTTSEVEATAPNVVRSLVSHPGTQTAAQDFLTGTANYNIKFDLLDFDYRRLTYFNSDYQVGYLAGVGVVQLEQTFIADLAGTGTEQVETDIDFYGIGGRFGLFGEAQVNCDWRVYGRGTGNLIAGEFRADYDQRQSFDPQVVDTAFKAGRIIGIWDLEVGLKRTSRCGNYSMNVGYIFSAWTNTLQTDEWIRGVRTNSVIDMDSTMTFDGLVARFDARF